MLTFYPSHRVIYELLERRDSSEHVGDIWEITSPTPAIHAYQIPQIILTETDERTSAIGLQKEIILIRLVIRL